MCHSELRNFTYFFRFSALIRSFFSIAKKILAKILIKILTDKTPSFYQKLDFFTKLFAKFFDKIETHISFFLGSIFGQNLIYEKIMIAGQNFIFFFTKFGLSSNNLSSYYEISILAKKILETTLITFLSFMKYRL